MTDWLEFNILMLCCCIYFQKKSGLDCEDGSNNGVKLWSLENSLLEVEILPLQCWIHVEIWLLVKKE